MLKKMIVFIACGFGTGYAPAAPGTFGSLLGLLVYYFMHWYSFATQIIITVCLIVLAVILAHIASKIMRQEDPGPIVIDEIAGQTIALWGVAFSGVNLIAGFILFRLFDIWKPFPIKRLEKSVPGGAGIVIDDLVAGLYARIILQIFIMVYPYFMSPSA